MSFVVRKIEDRLAEANVTTDASMRAGICPS